MNSKLDSEKVVPNIKDKLEDRTFSEFVLDCFETEDEIVETLSNEKYDYIQFKNTDLTETDAKLVASYSLIKSNKELDVEICLFICDDVIVYTTNPVAHKEQKINGEYELIEVSDAVDMINKGENL